MVVKSFYLKSFQSMRAAPWLWCALLICTFGANAQSFEHEMGQVEFTTPPSKVVTLDWVSTEHVLALGVTPVGVADVEGYKTWVQAPALPESVVSVGSRREPNLELLAQLKPDLIIMSNAMSAAYEKLNAIAPTMVLSVYTDAHAPLDAATNQLQTLGKVLDKSAQAEQVLAEFAQRINANKHALRDAVNAQRPQLLIRFIGEKHIRVHGQHSLAGETITKMGLTNAWTQAGNAWGFSSATVQDLAQLQSAEVFYFGPLTDEERQTIRTNPIWNVMGFVREQRVHELPAVWTFGGIKAAQRFSDLVTQQLLQKASAQ